MGDLRQRTFGEGDKQLAKLSDGELEEELLRRRRERAAKRGGRVDRKDVSPQDKRIEQWYANLELEPGASLEDVKQSYRELMRKFHPDKHVGDPDKHQAATEVAKGLTDAYRALCKHLEK